MFLEIMDRLFISDHFAIILYAVYSAESYKEFKEQIIRITLGSIPVVADSRLAVFRAFFLPIMTNWNGTRWQF